MSDGSGPVGRRDAVVQSGPIVVLAVVGALVGAVAGALVVGVVVGAVLGFGAVGWLRTRAVRIVLAVSRARPLAPGEFPRLRSLVDGLGLANGVQDVDLFVIDDDAPNALVVDGPGHPAAIAVTSGLVASLDRVELEGVVGQLLSRIKSGEARSSTLAAVFVGLVPLLGDVAGRPGRTDEGDPGRGGLLVGVGRPLRALAPLFGRLLRAAVPSSAVTTADLEACRMTRYPPGLVAAYDKIRRADGVTPAATSGTAHLWLEQPLSGLGDEGRSGDPHRRFVTHPTLDERISLLREL